MKTWIRLIGSAAGLALATAVRLPAQSEPVVSVDIIEIDVLSNVGSVLGVNVTDGGLGYATPPAVSFSGGGGSGAQAVATVSGGSVTGITITNGGTGYTSLPTVTIGPPNGVTPATATTTAANIVTPGGALTGFATIGAAGSGYTFAPTITITGGGGTGGFATATVVNGSIAQISLSGGSGYTSPPTLTIATVGIQATAQATALGARFTQPNESYGPYGTPIDIYALGRGTFLVSSFTYNWFVNGVNIGKTIGAVSPPTPAIDRWTPPQPGAYLLTASATDGANAATSLAIRYFATGTAIIGPVNNTLVPNGSSVVIQATATPAPVGGNAFVQRVEFYIDGTLRGTDYTYPYSFIYKPDNSPSTHSIEARAFDNNGNMVTPTATRSVQMVAPIGTPPTIRLLNPINNSSVSAGSTVTLTADATAPTGFIKNVDFYVNGVALASSQSFPFGSTWKSQVPGRYEFVAIAYDDKSNAVASTPVVVNVTGGFPTVAITNPPVTGATVIQGSTLSVAVTAAGADGGISSLSKIEFLVDGVVSDGLPKNPNNLVPPPPLAEPFIFNWRSSVSLGNHRLAARVTDVNGLIITSSEVPITVIPNQIPTISLTSPEPGATLTANSSVTLVAAASDTDGWVDTVEFFVNGASLGNPVTKSPWQFVWTPTAAGPYTLTAKVTDNAGATVTSSAVDVTVSPASTGSTAGGTNTIFSGDFQSATEFGKFSFGVGRTGRGTFIGYSTNPTGRIYFWSDIPISTDGTFSVTDSSNKVVLTGQTTSTGVSGMFGDRMFIGPITVGTTSPMILTGTFSGDASSTVTALVGANGSITLYTAAGTKKDAGAGVVGSNGSYTVSTPSGGSYSGNVTSSASIISGNAGGATSGTFLLQQVPSRLMNLSTRALAGSGERTLVTGFVVRGTGLKPLLVRAVGPTLANFGITNALPNPSVSLVNSSGGTVASNDDWNNNASVASVSAQLSAFPLNASSKDAAFTQSVAPATYSAVVGGASTAGTALVEIYDAESVTSGTARLTNLSSRAMLTNGDTLIAGFVIGGDVRKKLLIRAVGPTLSSFGITGAFEDPKLDVLVGTAAIASNDNWSASAVAATTTALNTFPLVSGSKDAATVVQLSPGSYTVHVTGTTSSGSGVVLIEIYDAD